MAMKMIESHSELSDDEKEFLRKAYSLRAFHIDISIKPLGVWWEWVPSVNYLLIEKRLSKSRRYIDSVLRKLSERELILLFNYNDQNFTKNIYR